MLNKGLQKVPGCNIWRIVKVLAVVAAILAAQCASPEGPSETVLSAVSPADTGTELPVFPGAEGYGTRTRAGRGGRVIAVTSLQDSGPGTLRQALAVPGPKIIVFRVGGVIRLRSHLFINHPFVTIAGQTAPGDGIVLRDFGIAVTTNDVLIQHIRVRPGDEGRVEAEQNDAIVLLGRHGDVTGARNIVLDHISASWSEDEIISVWYGAHDITVSWSIVSEALDQSRHSKDRHSAGLIVGDGSTRVSVHHNLLAHNDFRNPLFISGGAHAAVNNVIFNWGRLPTEIIDDEPMAVNFVGNFYRRGPSTEQPREVVIGASERNFVTKIFAAGNVRFDPSQPKMDAPVMVQFLGEPKPEVPAGYAAAGPFPLASITATDARTAADLVLRNAGATRPRRDAVDERVVGDVTNGTGRIIDSPAEVGGYPPYASGAAPRDSDADGMPDDWEMDSGLDPRNPRDNILDNDGDGYTNVEEYLHSLL